jgi:hypothetical protein
MVSAPESAKTYPANNVAILAISPSPAEQRYMQSVRSHSIGAVVLIYQFFKTQPKRGSLNNDVTESLQFVYGVPYEIVSTLTLDASNIPLFQGVQATCPL